MSLRHPLAVVAFAAVATLAFASPITAQTSPLVGSWEIEYERGRRVENDVVTPVMAKGTIAISPKGDSLVAVLQSGPTPSGVTPPPMTFTGKRTAEGATFVQKQQSRVVMNGEESIVDVVVTWMLTAEGDALSGSLLREAPMLAEQPIPTPVKGSRLKS